MEIDNKRGSGSRLRSASLDLLRSASLDLLKRSSMDLLKSVANSSNSPSSSIAQHLKVGGGMTNNDLLMQFQADLLGLSLYRPYSAETTALGAAFAAGLAMGYWETLDELRAVYRSGKQWDSRSEQSERDLLLSTWKNAVSRSLGWIGSTFTSTNDTDTSPMVPLKTTSTPSALSFPLLEASSDTKSRYINLS
jgi:hypothetical protein